MAYRILEETIDQLAGIPFKTLDEIVDQKGLQLLERFIQRTTNPEDRRIIFYCMKISHAAHEGDIRVITGDPYFKHPLNSAISTLEEEWGSLRVMLFCSNLLHDLLESKVEKEYKKMTGEDRARIFRKEKARMQKEGMDSIFSRLEEDGMVPEILEERTVKMRLRKDHFQDFSENLRKSVREMKISRQRFTKHLIRTVDKLSRFSNFNESYPHYLQNIFPTGPAKDRDIDMDSLIAIAVKIYERDDSIKEMASAVHEAYHALYPGYEALLRDVHNQQEFTKFQELREKITSLNPYLEQSLGKSFSGQKWLYECAKNNLVLIFSRAYFSEKKRFMYKAQLAKAEQKLIADTATALNTHRLKLLVYDFAPPDDERLKNLAEEYLNREGFSGMSDAYTEDLPAEEGFRIFDNTLGTYLGMMRMDQKGAAEKQETELNKTLQFQDAHGFLAMLDYLKNPNASVNIETKIHYDRETGHYTPTEEKITW